MPDNSISNYRVYSSVKDGQIIIADFYHVPALTLKLDKTSGHIVVDNTGTTVHEKPHLEDLLTLKAHLLSHPDRYAALISSPIAGRSLLDYIDEVLSDDAV